MLPLDSALSSLLPGGWTNCWLWFCFVPSAAVHRREKDIPAQKNSSQLGSKLLDHPSSAAVSQLAGIALSSSNPWRSPTPEA